MRPVERLIVALDLPERDQIMEMVRSLSGHVGMFKIGLEAYIAHGPSLVREVRDLGGDVFLDLKVHDIPRTAAAAATEASRLGVRLFTVHASGGADMIRAVRDAAIPEMKVVAVTVLTSLDEAAVSQIGYSGEIPVVASRLAELATSAGADGLVCSAWELKNLNIYGGLRVVPGIRPQGSDAGDQRRIATPSMAVGWGASWIVVGRPIVQDPDPVAAAGRIVAELDAVEQTS